MFLNFDTTCQGSSRVTLELKGTDLYMDGYKIPARRFSLFDGKKLANAIKENFTNKVALYEGNFTVEEVFENIIYLQKVYDLTLFLRLRSATFYKVRSKQALNFKESLYSTRQEIVKSFLVKSNLTNVQKIKLSNIVDSYLLPNPNSLPELYDVANDDLSKIEALLREVESIPTENTLHKRRYFEALNKVCKNVEVFRKFMEETGDDIVDYSSHKITRRLKKISIVYDPYITNYLIQKKIEHLLAKGVKKQEKKVKPSKLKSLIEKYNAGGVKDLEQSDLVRLLKNGNNNIQQDVIDYLNFETILSLFEESINKLTVRDLLRKYKQNIVNRLYWTIDREDQFGAILARIRKGGYSYHPIKENQVYQVSLDLLQRVDPRIPSVLIFKYHNLLTEEELRNYLVEYRDKIDIPQEVFNRIKHTLDCTCTKSITKKFIESYGKTNKLKLLKKCNEKDSPIKIFSRDYDNLISSVENKTTLKNILQVSFFPITDKIIKFILDNKDKKLAEHYLKVTKRYLSNDDWGSFLPQDIIVSLFGLFNTEEKIELLAYSIYYLKDLNVLIEEDELASFIERVIDQDVSYKEDILNRCLSIENFKDKVLRILIDKKYFFKIKGFMPGITEDTSLLKDFLKMYPFSIRSLGCTNMDIFDNFTREELVELSPDKDITKHPNAFFLAKFMTQDELFKLADINEDFLIRHMDMLGYEYFKKVKDLFLQKNKTYERHLYLKDILRENSYRGLSNRAKETQRKIREILKNR